MNHFNEFQELTILNWVKDLYSFEPSFHPNLLPVQTFLLLMLLHLSSSFAAVIIDMPNRDIDKHKHGFAITAGLRNIT